MEFPSEKLKKFKFENHEKILIPYEAEGNFEYKTNKLLTYNDDKKINLEADVKHVGTISPETMSEGSFKVVIGVLEHPSYQVESQYKYVPAKDKMTTMTVSGKVSPTDVSGDLQFSRSSDWSKIQLKTKVNTKLDKINNLELDMEHEVSKIGL